MTFVKLEGFKMKIIILQNVNFIVCSREFYLFRYFVILRKS